MASSEMPASFGVHGPGRNEEPSGRPRAGSPSTSIAVVLDDVARRPELAQVLDEVERERVVVVDDEDAHRGCGEAWLARRGAVDLRLRARRDAGGARVGRLRGRRRRRRAPASEGRSAARPRRASPRGPRRAVRFGVARGSTRWRSRMHRHERVAPRARPAVSSGSRSASASAVVARRAPRRPSSSDAAFASSPGARGVVGRLQRPVERLVRAHDRSRAARGRARPRLRPASRAGRGTARRAAAAPRRQTPAARSGDLARLARRSRRAALARPSVHPQEPQRLQVAPVSYASRPNPKSLVRPRDPELDREERRVDRRGSKTFRTIIPLGGQIENAREVRQPVDVLVHEEATEPRSLVRPAGRCSRVASASLAHVLNSCADVRSRCERSSGRSSVLPAVTRSAASMRSAQQRPVWANVRLR